MRIYNVVDKTHELYNKLVKVWEDSVRATHDFLTESEIEKIKLYVPEALKRVQNLVVAEEDGEPIAFIGVENKKIEMLFVSPENRGKGIGRQLVNYAINNFGINTVTVNEQSPQAVGFYGRLGFEIYKRTDTDEQGNNYPLLYMRLR